MSLITASAVGTSPDYVFGDFASFIEGQIERRAGGQIRDLHVVYGDDEIILLGRSRTYHAKQLAQQAVLDLVEGFRSLTNRIVVC